MIFIHKSIININNVWLYNNLYVKYKKKNYKINIWSFFKDFIELYI